MSLFLLLLMLLPFLDADAVANDVDVAGIVHVSVDVAAAAVVVA